MTVENRPDLGPDTGDAGIYFAHPPLGAAAGTVLQLLWASGNGAQTARVFQNTVTAAYAALLPDARLRRLAHKVGIKTRQDRRVHVFFRQCLHTHTACHRQDRIILFNILLKRCHKLLDTLPLHRDFFNFKLLAFSGSRGSQSRCHGAGLFLTASKTDRNAGAASHGEHFLFALEHSLDIFQRFLFCNDHAEPLANWQWCD